METRRIQQLRPHPDNDRIYHDHADSDLIDSVRDKGIINPLLVTRDNIIINGHRRFDAAKRVGLHAVPVVVFGSMDELDILEALVESNRQRQKSNEQMAREAQILIDVEKRRNERIIRQKHAVLQESKSHQPVEKRRDAYKTAGERLGRSHTSVQQSVRVVEAIDTLEQSGKKREAQQLRTTLNKSVKRAYDTAKEAGHIQVQAPAAKKAVVMADHITLDEWRSMSDADKEIAMMRRSDRAKFNWQDENNIEWALWSWNPVTGCKHNCPYCYARDIANRFYPQKFEPAFLPERLSAPFNTPMKPEAETNIGYKNVFTCSMADLFGRWVPHEWIEVVLDTIAQAPQWNFLFLTKFPIRLAEFDFPDNAWVGTTVDCQARVRNAEEAFNRVNAKVKWLSCEPLLEPLQFSDLSMFQWIVLGGSSASSQTPEWRPPREWISEIERKAWDAGCMVYEKTNLLERVKQYPGQHANEQVRLPDALQYLPSVEAD